MAVATSVLIVPIWLGGHWIYLLFIIIGDLSDDNDDVPKLHRGPILLHSENRLNPKRKLFLGSLIMFQGC